MNFRGAATQAEKPVTDRQTDRQRGEREREGGRKRHRQVERNEQ